MKIVKVYTLKRRGTYAASEHWRATRKQIHDAVRECEWPVGSGSFTIYRRVGKSAEKGTGSSRFATGLFIRCMMKDGRLRVRQRMRWMSVWVNSMPFFQDRINQSLLSGRLATFPPRIGQ